MELAKNTSAIKSYRRLMRFASWLQQIPDKVTPPPFRLIQIGSAFWQSRALYTGTKLAIADELGDAEKSTKTLAEALNIHEDHLYRLMRMLASLDIFTETSPRTFRNSRLSDHLRKDNPIEASTKQESKLNPIRLNRFRVNYCCFWNVDRAHRG